MSLTAEDMTQVRDVVIDALEAIVLPQFQNLNQQISGLDQRMDGLDKRMDGLDKRMGNLENRMDSLDNRMVAVERRLTSLELKFDNFEGRLEALENDVKDIYKILSNKPQQDFGHTAYKSLSDNEKLLVLHQELLSLAKQKGLELPH